MPPSTPRGYPPAPALGPPSTTPSASGTPAASAYLEDAPIASKPAPTIGSRRRAPATPAPRRAALRWPERPPIAQPPAVPRGLAETHGKPTRPATPPAPGRFRWSPGG